MNLLQKARSRSHRIVVQGRCSPAHKALFINILLGSGVESEFPDSRFILAYDAAHSLALAALRWHGYRSENRYIVFQVLDSTVSFPAAKWRFRNVVAQS